MSIAEFNFLNGTSIGEDEFWRLNPALYAKKLDPHHFQLYEHVSFIADKVAECAMMPNGRLIIEVPPRHGKSTLISKWTPTWFLDLFPFARVAVCSYMAELATEFGRQVRNESQSNPLVKFKLRTDSKAANKWNTEQGGGMVAAGVDGPLTGRGYDLGLIDDPIKNWREAKSPARKRVIKDWFESTFYTRQEPGASIIVLQTRWDEGDLAGWLQKHHSDDWEVINLPAIALKNDPLGRNPGEALCPARYDEEALDRLRRGSSNQKWISLYQGRPQDDDGGVFKNDWWKFYVEHPKAMYEKMQRIVHTWDLTFDGEDEKNNKNADIAYNVGQVWGVQWPNFYLLAQVRKQMEFTEQIDEIEAMAKLWPSHEILIEKAANGSAAISTLRSKIPGLTAIKPKGSKLVRATSVTPAVREGNVFLPDPSVKGNEWVSEEYLPEFSAFPNSEYKDQVDATSQVLLRLLKERESIMGVPESMEKLSAFDI